MYLLRDAREDMTKGDEMPLEDRSSSSSSSARASSSRSEKPPDTFFLAFFLPFYRNDDVVIIISVISKYCQCKLVYFILSFKKRILKIRMGVYYSGISSSDTLSRVFIFPSRSIDFFFIKYR